MFGFTQQTQITQVLLSNSVIQITNKQPSMSHKLKFKIISCSSEQQQFPVSSLLFAGSEGWQTRRFCTYPQEITLEFYGVVNIRKIQLVSDHRKISSQVDILYYVPTGHEEHRFYKYGFLQFNRNQTGLARQQKTIVVDINCLYIRFLFHKPYQTKENFFSQIGIKSLVLYGSDQPENILPITSQIQQNEERGQLNQDDEEYIAINIAKLTAEKDNEVKQQNFDRASYFKGCIELIHNFGKKLRENRAKIRKALENEDYDRAKQINLEIRRIKDEIQDILQGKIEDNVIEEQQDNQFAEVKEKEENGNSNEFMQQEQSYSRNLTNSRNSNKLHNSRPIKPMPIQQQNYDERVIPVLRGDRVKSQNDEFGDEKPKPPPPVEEVEGKYIKEATIMQEFFDQVTIKKFFSQHWQHNLDALNTIFVEMKKKHKEASLVKCLISVVKFSCNQTNFQVSLISLNIFLEMLKINQESQMITKPGQLQNDLDQIGKQIVRKLTDNNPKIKTAAEQSFAQMTSSLLYGVEACSFYLTKSKTKLSSKQLATRLTMITKMIEQYGIANGAISVPLTTLDFAIENTNNPAQQVRRHSVALLSTAYRKDKIKTQPKIGILKESVLQQIQNGVVATPKKPKKK